MKNDSMEKNILILMKLQKVIFNAETAKIAETISLKYNKFVSVSGRILERAFASSASFVAKPGFRLALKFSLFTKLLIFIFPVLLFAHGSLMLVGGGGENYNSWSDMPYQWFVDQADSGIIINIDVDDADSWYRGYFISFGADDGSKALRIENKSIANDSLTYKMLIQANGIFIEGGDQWDYVSTWKNTLVEEAIKKVFADGGVIGGTSAGLAILGEVYFDAKFGGSYPDDAAVNCRNTDIHLDNEFLDLMPGILTDSHFHQRGRIGRLIPMLAKWKTDRGEDLTGIGIDEKTALCIDENNYGKVFGKASVTIVKPTEMSDYESIAGKSVKYTNLCFDQLVHGVEYDFNNFTIINPENLASFSYEDQNFNYNEITLNGNDDNILSSGSVKVNRLISNEYNAWYGRLTLSAGNNQVPNSVIINKIWQNNDYYENRFVGGLYAIGNNPGITAIYLGENSNISIDNQGKCTIGDYAYFIDSRSMTYYGFPQKNDPTAPIPASNHPVIFNARLHFFNNESVYELQDSTQMNIEKSENIQNPDKYKIGLMYPNPFNGIIRVNYEVYKSSNLSFSIVDICGNKVKELCNRKHQQGNYTVFWSGENNNDNSVSAGVYFLLIFDNDLSRINYCQKILFLK